MLRNHLIVHLGAHIINNVNLARLGRKKLKHSRFRYQLESYLEFLFMTFIFIALEVKLLDISRRRMLTAAIRACISAGKFSIGVMILGKNSPAPVGKNLLLITPNRALGRDRVVLQFGVSLPSNMSKLIVKKRVIVDLGGNVVGGYRVNGVLKLRCLLGMLGYLKDHMFDAEREFLYVLKKSKNMFENSEWRKK